MKPVLWIRRAVAPSISVPFVLSTVRGPSLRAYSANANSSGRMSGSPPDKSTLGTTIGTQGYHLVQAANS